MLKTGAKMSYFISIFFGTFVLEDLALASSVTLIGKGEISFVLAFAACFAGITIGDLGLYFIGYLFLKLKPHRRVKILSRFKSTFSRLRESNTLTYAIVISRAIPGTRLPTYLASGYLKYSFANFFLLTVCSVFVWVLMALSVGKAIPDFLFGHIIWTVVFFLLALTAIKKFIGVLVDPWARKYILHFWRKFFHFEFWPAVIFYLPIVPRYIFLSFKYRNPFLPFYANPLLANGGLIGESKWDFIRHLDPLAPSTLPGFILAKTFDPSTVPKQIKQLGFNYPIIFKPDVGQRGFGVRIIRNETELHKYLSQSDFDIVVQKFSSFNNEAGIFYIRIPGQERGFIFSITDKKFPFIQGDGTTKLGDLILRDRRARIIAPTYFARLTYRLDWIPAKEEIVFISECGNHCQGAIFENGNSFITEALTNRIDKIAKGIPEFYFGRFDVKYKSLDSLKQGNDFEIVEVNGAGSEATHIWDSQTSLIGAYKVLYQQWDYLFQIGAFQYANNKPLCRLHFVGFLKEVLKVNTRSSDLVVSS